MIKNDVFGVLVYAPAAARYFSPRYASDPDATDFIVIKNDVFGVLL